MATNWGKHFAITRVVHMVIYPLSQLSGCLPHIESPAPTDHKVDLALCSTGYSKFRVENFTIGEYKSLAR